MEARPEETTSPVEAPVAPVNQGVSGSLALALPQLTSLFRKRSSSSKTRRLGTVWIALEVLAVQALVILAVMVVADKLAGM